MQPHTLFPKGLVEYTTPVYENHYTRILLLKKKIEQKTTRIEIEVSLPLWMWELTTNQNTGDFTPNQRTFQCALNEMISLFQYLLQLQAIGFKLDFIHEEGIWVAGYILDKEPTYKFYKQLIPPRITQLKK